MIKPTAPPSPNRPSSQIPHGPPVSASRRWLGLLFCAAPLLACDLHAEAPADTDVQGLAYFRQRYPTRVEIDADGKIRDVPLPDPMSVERLHLALSTDGRHWTPLAANGPVWDQQLRDPFIERAPDGVWHLMAPAAPPAIRGMIAARCACMRPRGISSPGTPSNPCR